LAQAVAMLAQAARVGVFASHLRPKLACFGATV